ncbi:hypothetical protein [Halorussus aquaticus]|uniref:Cox cluster protein n=1 Tax=Halorussus aquaticus TaxID=2953748 RepID=A0ABD5PYY6_9EURY|nr:hypothetical protein [Halorussus aquaticus]
MDRGRIGDIILGVAMVLLGVAPVGLVVTGRTQLVVASYGPGGFPENLTAIFTLISAVCGLILAVGGINVMRGESSDATSPSLY